MNTHIKEQLKENIPTEILELLQEELMWMNSILSDT
jgi:hypothetical protein